MTVKTRGGVRGPGGTGQSDLFGTPRLPGLAYGEDLIGAAEEAELIAGIREARLTPFRFQQWEGKRLTRSFGWTYDFQTGRFARGEPARTGSSRCASAQHASPGSRPMLSSSSSSSNMAWEQASAGTRIGRYSIMSSEFRSAHRH